MTLRRIRPANATTRRLFAGVNGNRLLSTAGSAANNPPRTSNIHATDTTTNGGLLKPTRVVLCPATTHEDPTTTQASSPTIEVEEMVVEELFVDNSNAADGEAPTADNDGSGEVKKQPSSSSAMGAEEDVDEEEGQQAPKLSPEELERRREEEQMERFRIFQQQAAAYYASQQQQEGSSPNPSSADGANAEASPNTASAATPAGQSPDANAAASPNTSANAASPPQQQQQQQQQALKYSRRFTYVNEADRHKAATAGTTVHFDRGGEEGATTTTAGASTKDASSTTAGSATTSSPASDNKTSSSNSEGAPTSDKEAPSSSSPTYASSTASTTTGTNTPSSSATTNSTPSGNASSSTSTTQQQQQPPPPVVEVLHPDLIIWETFIEHPDGTKGYVNIIANDAFGGIARDGGDGGKRDGSDAAGGGGATKPAADIIGGSHFIDVGAVDPFSKGKVLNYINRHKDQLPSSLNNKNGKFFEIEEKEIKLGKTAMAAATSSWAGGSSALNNIFGDPDSVFIYRAKLHVPLPAPHASYVAEGMAESEKDAECLAAMHAERVVDAMGGHLYRLPSAQTKHAEAARKVGRKAPFPGDAVMPEGTPIPPPMRMISSQISEMILRKYGSSDAADDGSDAVDQKNNGSSAAKGFHEHFSLGGACHEAEVIEPAASTSSANNGGGANSGPDVTLKDLPGLNMTSRMMYRQMHAAQYAAVSAAIGDVSGTFASGGAVGSDGNAVDGGSSNSAAVPSSSAEPSSPAPISPYSVTGTTSAFVPPANEPPNPVDELYQTFHYPWRDGVNVDDTVDPHASPEQVYQREQAIRDQQLKANANRMGFGNTASTAAKFDPTENNTFQITNVVSVRFSPSDDSVQLAAIFDRKAQDRIKEWLQVTQNVFDMKTRITVSQVAVVGFASRMFVVEMAIDEKEPNLIAKGKAVDKDVAIALACMHAELLIDATGRQLFPRNQARQAKHSAEVQGYGRWAYHPNRPNERPPTDHLPLPLKQQLGLDDIILDANTTKSLRTPEERLLAAHNEIYNTVYDFLEVNPEPRSGKQAREIIRRWQREIARSRIDDLYVCTRMGDYYRASCVLPVPPQFGTRGGNAIGRSPEQAMDLCAIHCLDVLCSLNIPVFRDPKEQAAFVAERRRNGLIVPNEAQGIIKPEIAGKRVFIPYTPGFLIEGDKLKPQPPVNDLTYILGISRNHEQEFILPVQQQSNEKDILEHGNEARLNVQMYCRRTVGIVDQVPNVFITGFAKGSSVYNISYLSLMIDKRLCHEKGVARSFPAPLTEGLDEATRDVTRNIMGEQQALRVVGDPIAGHYRFLAVGASLKKADSIRMCFLHAAEILKSFGIDISQEKNIFLTSKKKGISNPPPQQQPKRTVTPPPPPRNTQQAATPTTTSPPPSAATMKPIKPRRLQSVSAPAAGVTTMTMSSTTLATTGAPTRTSRLQPVTTTPAGSGANKPAAAQQQHQQPPQMANKPAAPVPPPQSTVAAAAAPKPATPAASAPPQSAVDTLAATSPASATATTASCSVAASAPTPPFTITDTADPSMPPAVYPKPFLHPLMRTFFYNTKLERAQQKRMQNRTNVMGGKR